MSGFGNVAARALQNGRATKIATSSAQRTGIAKAAVGAGLVCITVGTAWPIVKLFIHHPWLILLMLGFTLLGGGSAVLLQEQGVCGLLPPAVKNALGMSLLEIIFTFRASLKQVRNPSAPAAPTEADPDTGGGLLWVANLGRLAAICFMDDLDDELLYMPLAHDRTRPSTASLATSLQPPTHAA